METLKASFNVPSDDQGSNPDDFSVYLWWIYVAHLPTVYG